MHIINPHDRYVSDNPSSPDYAPSRAPISFSLKAPPVVSITPTSAIYTGQENRSPTSCVPFPLSPQIPSTEPCRDAMYIPRPGALFSAPEQPGNVPPTYVHRRQRSNSGLMTSIQHRTLRPLATLNSESRVRGGSMIDLGKSTAVLSITPSGTVSRTDCDHFSKNLAISRQRRFIQLDRKRNASISMITRKRTTKASVDSKFLITLHHSITWHIENRSDQKGSQELDAQDGLLAQRIFQHLTQKGQIPISGLGSEHAKGSLMYAVPLPFPASDSSASSSSASSPASIPGPGVMTMAQIVAALHMKHRDRSTRMSRPRNLLGRNVSTTDRRSPLSQFC